MRIRRVCFASVLTLLVVAGIYVGFTLLRPHKNIKTVISPDLVQSWSAQKIIGRSHTDRYLIAYIKTKIIPIPPLTSQYNLKRADRKDFSQKNQTLEVKKLFKEKGIWHNLEYIQRNGTFIEVGAHNGEKFSNTLYWEREYGWTGLLIEPGPAYFKSLLKKNRKAYALQACLCPTNFAYMVKFWNIGTGGKIAGPKLIAKVKTIDIPCYPFYSVMAAMDFPTIDFLSLDVEGLELAVLKTIPFNVINIRMMLVEFPNMKQKFSDLTTYMESQGYYLHKVLEIDAIFVKNGEILAT